MLEEETRIRVIRKVPQTRYWVCDWVYYRALADAQAGVKGLKSCPPACREYEERRKKAFPA